MVQCSPLHIILQISQSFTLSDLKAWGRHLTFNLCIEQIETYLLLQKTQRLQVDIEEHLSPEIKTRVQGSFKNIKAVEENRL